MGYEVCRNLLYLKRLCEFITIILRVFGFAQFLFHNVTEEIVGSAQNTRASSLKNVQWASQTLPFGWSVSGLVTPAVTGDFYNCVARSNSSTLIATGDDNGVIKLFRYPMAAVVRFPICISRKNFFRCSNSLEFLLLPRAINRATPRRTRVT
jgi:hypothetical protein